MRKYLPVAVVLTYLILLAIWVVAFISNLPASRKYVSQASTAAQNTNGSEQSSGIFATQPVDDYPNLVSSLRAVGRTVAPTGKRALTLLNGKGQVITLNGNEVQIFEYADISTANTQASQISADGASISERMISWSSTPHFYKKDKLIVLYVGKDPLTINTLRELLGSQFAGG